MTGQWEADLAKIEREELKERDFRKGIESYATQITEELLSSKILFPKNRATSIAPNAAKAHWSSIPDVPNALMPIVG